MSTLKSRAMTIGITVLLISVGTGIHFVDAGDFGLLLCFVGVLVGASHVAASIRMADEPTMGIVPVVLTRARALAALVRHNAAAAGLVMASCAITAVSGEEDPAFCFGMLALLLLGLILVNIGAHGD